MRRGAVRAIVLAVLAVWVPRSVQGAGAAPAAKPSASVKIVPRLNAYFATGFNDAAWQKGALDKVLKNWKPKGLPKPGAKTVLISTIGKEGTVTGARDHLLTGDRTIRTMRWRSGCCRAAAALCSPSISGAAPTATRGARARASSKVCACSRIWPTSATPSRL